MGRASYNLEVIPFLAACVWILPQDPPSRETLTILSLLPRTGSAKPQTDPIVDGIRLALEHGDGPFALQYEDRDTASVTGGRSPDYARMAEAVVRDPEVMVVLGTYNSGAAVPMLPVFNRAGLLMISPTNTWPGLTKGAEAKAYRPSGRLTYLRIVPADDIQGEVGADWAKRLAATSAFVLDDREVYGKEMADRFEARARRIGLRVLGREGVDPMARDFKPLWKRIRSLEPDLVYFGGTTQTKAGEIARDMMSVGFPGRFMVPDGCFEDAFLESAGASNLAGRCYITFGGIPPDHWKGPFVERYTKRYGRKPGLSAVYGYECARVALAAIRRAGRKDREAIRAAAVAIRDFEGAWCTWSFDENGDTTHRTLSGWTVRDGRFAFVSLLP